jgi:hypothetical protein
MPGLTMTEESLKAQVESLLQEQRGYQSRADAAASDADRERWEARVEQVREQLRARGAEAASPHRRSAKRDGRAGQETRA